MATDPGPTVILAIGNSADPAEVARHLRPGRLAHTRDGRRPLLVYADAPAAIRDVAAYLASRPTTFVRFGLHAGELPAGAERLGGPVVDAALRLADRAGTGLLVSAAARDLLAGEPLGLEPVDEATFRLSRRG